jgi:hypothetical protein
MSQNQMAAIISLLAWGAIMLGWAVVGDWLDERRAERRKQKL